MLYSKSCTDPYGVLPCCVLSAVPAEDMETISSHLFPATSAEIYSRQQENAGHENYPPGGMK